VASLPATNMGRVAMLGKSAAMLCDSKGPTPCDQ
jgi:hypothetical protein